MKISLDGLDAEKLIDKGLLHIEVDGDEIDCIVVGHRDMLINMVSNAIIHISKEVEGDLHDNVGDFLEDMVDVINSYFDYEDTRTRKGN